MSEIDSLYSRNILNKRSELSFLPSKKSEKNVQIKNNDILLPNLSSISIKEHKRGVYYISDIHLDHKLLQKFGLNNATDTEVINFIEKIVDDLLQDDDGKKIDFSIPATILILGDTSHSFEINKIFYEALSRKASIYEDIFVILGNHELWEFKSVDQAILAYDSLFKELLNIHLLQNSLYIDRYGVVVDEWFNDSGVDLQGGGKKTSEERHKYWMDKCILTKNDLQKMTTEELRKTCLDSKAIVFGTIGFSSLNNKFNAKDGIYRNAITTVEQEKILAKESADIYKKLTIALPKSHLIIASHMPLSDWTELPYQPGWLYFNGHTHKNRKIINENEHIYADNQIGYFGKRIKFKAIVAEHKFDYFSYYKDGIYNISETDYHKFYFGLSKSMVSVDKRSNGEIKMIKNKGIYLFLLEKQNGEICLLEGGKHRVLNNQNIDYYYSNVALLNETITESIDRSGIRDYLNQLSSFIKRIGGRGYIHGNIIDIDFLNHIMVDIRSGKLLPYFAYSVADRYEYPDIPKLLQENRPDLYKKFIEAGSRNLPVLKKSSDMSYSVEHSTDASIYHDSNIMLKIQDMLDYNVVRFWDDNLIDSIIANKNRDLQDIDNSTYSLPS